MIRTIFKVIQGEGVASAFVRAGERTSEAVHQSVLRTRGLFAGRANAAIVNVSVGGISPRSGGVAVQLMARMRAERALRNIALLHPGGLLLSSPFTHMRRIGRFDFDTAVRNALFVTGANAVHIEGTYGVPLEAALRLLEPSRSVVLSVHDFSLFSEQQHLLELARRLLESATGVIFPSNFLLEKHRELFALSRWNAEVVEPASPAADRHVLGSSAGRGIAYAGSVKRHKGGHLLPEVAAMLATRGLDLHVFGGGDADLLRALRRRSNVVIHGYYRSETLPSLLERHHIGLVVFPTIVPEAYSLTLSEVWLAGASVAAFDLGAQADRIRLGGGGWLAPLESGAAGLVDIADRWLTGSTSARIARPATSPADAARAHVELYRRWAVLPRQ